VIDHYAEFTPGQIIAPEPTHRPDVRRAAPTEHRRNGGHARAAVHRPGDRDELVPKPVTDQYVQRACGVGDHLLYRVYPGQDHIGARDASVKDVQAWMAARVAGQPAPSTC